MGKFTHDMQPASKLVLFWSLLFLLGANLPASFAEGNKPAPEQKFVAILIWGTDGEKPQGKDLKEVDQHLVGKFRKIFKWQNYYEVGRQPATMKPGDEKHLKLSPKCEVKLKQTEKEGMEVELYGEGKFVVKRKQTMPLSDILILAGDDKNATAWFVVIKPE